MAKSRTFMATYQRINRRLEGHMTPSEFAAKVLFGWQPWRWDEKGRLMHPDEGNWVPGTPRIEESGRQRGEPIEPIFACPDDVQDDWLDACLSAIKYVMGLADQERLRCRVIPPQRSALGGLAYSRDCSTAVAKLYRLKDKLEQRKVTRAAA